jgi:peroxiredoxin
MSDAAVERLAEVRVLDGDGRQVRLGDCWDERPVVLAMIRHFGCLFCKEQVAELSKVAGSIHELGAELVVLGNGGPQHVRWFIEDFGVTTPVLTDPSLESYDAVGAKHGWLSGANPQTFLASLRAWRKGYRQTGTKGDRFQQGGVFVIMPDGSMPFRYVSRYAGDHPAPGTVVHALERAAGAARPRA